MTKGLSRRRLLSVGVALPAALPLGGAVAETIRGETPWSEGRADHPSLAPIGEGYSYFTPAEAAFVEAAVGRLIPKDELGAGAVEAGVPVFLDRQLGGDYGKALRWYMGGPWSPGLPTQGYQSRFTPAQMYRAAIRAIDAAVARDHGGAAFAKLSAGDQDKVLENLEAGRMALDGVDAKAFFKLLLQNTIEGFFSDPIYGGNRDMVGWKLIGFPGARYDQRRFASRYGEPYPLPPVGIAGRSGWHNGG